MHIRLTILALFALALSALADERPNVILINVDDLGWNDVQYLDAVKSPYYTPNIQKLASKSLVFNNGYAASAVCSPTRASLITGQSPGKLKLTAHIPGKLSTGNKRVPKEATLLPIESLHQLPKEEITFAEILKNAGYRTGFIGKWHLAGADVMANKSAQGVMAPEFHPDQQGFDINIAGCAMGQPISWFDPYKNKTIQNDKRGEYLTDRLTRESVKFIEQNKAHKFLLYLNPYSVHTPIKAPKDRIKEIASKIQNKKRHTYAAMIYSVDLMIAEIMKTLERLNLSENTLLIFTSDNGGLFENAPLRDHKGTLYEGGLRVPYIIHWPAKIKEARLSSEASISYDLFPTIVDAVGLKKDIPDAVEGESLMSIIEFQTFTRQSPLIWHYPHYHHGGMGSMDMGTAIRIGDWKYIYLYKTDRSYLFNLKNDISEQENLISSEAERAEQMKAILFKTLKKQDALIPQKK